MKRLILILSLMLIAPASLHAQHPIDIQRLAAQGEYLSSLIEYAKIPKRRITSEAMIAAARSAWGLSLPARAIEEYELALRDEKLAPEERARIYLSRAIIEYQEERYQTAVLYAERSAGLIATAGPLRAKAWFVWAQSLDQMALYGAAEEKYLKAIEEGELDDKGEMYYRIGVCQMRLGKKDQARISFEKVPLRHERTAATIRQLAEVSLESGNYQEAAFWLNKGRNEYPDSFLDSWVDYALMKAAIAQDKTAHVNEVLEDAGKRYPPSDPWFSLLRAAAAAYQWRDSNAFQSNIKDKL